MIVGAGHGGVAAAFALRDAGWEGTVCLLDRETVPPYHKPPLSKAWLDRSAKADLQLRKAAAYADAGIDLQLGADIARIDRDAQQLQTVAGDTIGYDALILATGAVARPWVDSVPQGVFTLRTFADAELLKEVLREGREIVIVGGGYIGLEVASTAAKKGLKVRLVEAADRLLERGGSPDLSAFVAAELAAQGVEIKTNARVDAFETDGDQVTGITFADGTRWPAGIVLLALGALPALALAAEAGLETQGGILVDEACRTSDPLIWAIGDCTVFPRNGAFTRLESIQNAQDQAAVAARGIVGADTGVPVYAPVPTFWSEIAGVRLQMVGWPGPVDRVIIRDGYDGKGRSHWCFSGQELVRVESVNCGRSQMVGKRALASRITPEPADLGDPDFKIADILKAAPR